ncbi:uncharacterized protein LOC143567393 [Bidens hawaiensis]|uniref:uncharacterized protein LOC143567393 n=2 Tax=Bidens hawaiensis TaxID=980011 RepID=UPI00404B4762
MEPKNLIKLRDLDATKTNYTIKVRVVRLWRKPNNKNPNEIWSIEMIIMDEEHSQLHKFSGNKDAASVFKTYFPKFEEHLRENECYFIFRPTLADNDAKIKHVDNGQKISFRWQTDLKKCTTFKGSKGRHIILTLWEEYCQQMLNYMQNKQQAHVFLILQFGNLHIYGHNRTVSNVYDATRLFINSPIDEILEFKKSFLSNIGEETSSHRSVGTSMVSSLEDEFLNDIDFINIREINEIKEVKSLIVVGKIKALCIEKSWNYRSCDLCKNGVETTTVRIDKGENPADFEVAKQYKCLNDNCTQTIVSSPMTRYKIPIRVQDCTGTVTLTMFEREANKLIGRIAKDVLDEQEQSAEFLTLPAAFNVLLERKFAFRIEIKNYNLDNNAEYFSITKLTEDLNIISKLEKNFYNNQVEDSDSVNPSNSELPLQTDVSLKDSISCTADNGTPISNSNESMGTAASVDLKRNLEDVYDVDESSALSSTKQQKIHTKDLRDANWNETLLIPKTEKYTRTWLKGKPLKFHLPLKRHTPVILQMGTCKELLYLTFLMEMSKSNTPESASSSKAPVNGHASNWDMQRTAISSADVRKLNASEARKSRKLLLDSRRSNISPNTQKSNKPFSSSINSTSITQGKENVTPNTMITNQSSLQTFHENTKNPTSLGDINSVRYPFTGASTSKNNRSTSLCDTRRVYISSPIMASSNCASTSLTKLSSGKRKLISNSRITNPIPMLDLTSDEEVDVEVLVKDPFKGISTDYLDHGDQNLICELCHAKLWKNEGGIGKKRRKNNLFPMLWLRRQQDGRTYNLPSSSEVAALIVGDIGNIEPRDIIVETKTGSLKHISELHPSYVPLQYPLFYIYGDDCYRVDIPHRDFRSLQKSKRPNCTMREFFAYRIQDRPNIFSLPLNGRRLFQQQLVDIYTMIETERLNYIRKKQKVLRCESYENIHNLKNTKNQDMSRVGQRVILPSSFTGGSRYMMQNYLDAMAICRWYGYPDFFITITCNPKWPEVKRFLNSTTINPEDRPDIMCRFFKVKLDAIIKDLKKDEVLGKVQAVVYTVEFQKRGLPHTHICLFMHADHKLPTVDHIDPFISAEIPDKKEDHELYSLFPKKFTPHNSIDSNGYPIYRRRDSECTVKKSAVDLDNRSVVPYNKTLLKRYQAHINVEWCNQAASIKYLFKYINKGPDRATVAVVDADNQDDQDKARDEIREYYDCRYLSACEAAWRIFAFEVHYNSPSVIRLPFHLPGQQQVTYGPDDDIDDVLNKPSVSSSMFSAWMLCNQINDEARNLTYVEFPTKFVWKLEQRKWERRKQGFSIGRIHQVSPSLGEAYF